MTKTSDTHPLIINSVQVPYVNGTIGMTFCPGKKGQGLYSGTWSRDLGKDLSAIIDWGANALVSLVEDHEFDLLKVSDFKDQVQRSKLQWFHLPIVDVSVPCEKFERAWVHEGNRIRRILARGGKVVSSLSWWLGPYWLVGCSLIG
jgi:protein-tyrosine phosphatase